MPSDAETTNRTHQHLCDLDALSISEIEDIFYTAETMHEILARPIRQVPTLRGTTVATLFGVPDEAAQAAFTIAAQALSAEVIALPPRTHGATPPDALLDTVQTVQAFGADILVLRHGWAGAPYQVLPHFGGTVINAGDGAHANPVQALTDLFTLRSVSGAIDTRKVVMVGNVLQSGRARSNLWGLTTLRARVTLCAPASLLGPEDFWRGTWPEVQISYNLNDAIEDADVVILLPVAAAACEPGMLLSQREYRKQFTLTPQHLELAHEDVVILPADPLQRGIELAPELEQPLQQLRARHTRNGIAIAMALLYRAAGSPRAALG